MLSGFIARYLARKIASASFIGSEGWRSTIPRSIERIDPYAVRADHLDHDQQEDATAVHEPGEAPDPAVVRRREDEQQAQPDPEIDPLTDDQRAEALAGDVERRAVDHHQTVCAKREVAKSISTSK